MNENKQKIQWQPLVELIVVLMTILGSTIPLYIHTDSKLTDAMSKIDATLQGMKEDMRDFHTKLVLQDQEYKNHLLQFHRDK
jgi:hypothetical protein